jgi:hypothetical protein
LAANIPTPNPDASTKDTDRVLTRSVAKLAITHQDNSINDAIDQLVDQLAAFCLQKVEQNTSKDDDIDISVEELEEEIQVQDNTILKGHS